MPKILQLTLELNIQKVSCPGVWLCQDGRVSLTVFALGTTYQTCLLPPIFPIMFKDVFYFRKRFKQNCALNNICCLLKDETIYCELVQWTDDCESGPYVVLAQFLGSLNDVLFPPNMCWGDGVDLLMRRCKDFPGILAPKIEVLTKMRIQDEVTDFADSCDNELLDPATSCKCRSNSSQYDAEGRRQKTVCHSPMYHSRRHNLPRYENTEHRQKLRACVDPATSRTSCPNISPCGDRSRHYRSRSPEMSKVILLPIQTHCCNEGTLSVVEDDVEEHINRQLYPIPERLHEDIDDELKSFPKHRYCIPCPAFSQATRARSCSPNKPIETSNDVTDTGLGMDHGVENEDLVGAVREGVLTSRELTRVFESERDTRRDITPSRTAPLPQESTELSHAHQTSTTLSKTGSSHPDSEVSSSQVSHVEDDKLKKPIPENIKDHELLKEVTRPERSHTNCACPPEVRSSKILLESRFVKSPVPRRSDASLHQELKTTQKACICEICQRYHELFHTGQASW